MKQLTLDHFSNHVAILQLDNLYNTDRITTYIKSLPAFSIILFGEYIADPFFSDQWINYPIQDLKNENKIDFLVKLANEYNHIIVIPVIQYKNRGYYKTMKIISCDGIREYMQQRLIQYEHWNEVKFFSNDTLKLPHTPFIFTTNTVKVGVLFGFEAHFDEFWMEFKKANVDIVLVATASTFNSQERWRNLLTTHAFTNSCYVFRANRIGCYQANDESEWRFYGHSFVSLGQEIIDEMQDDEGMLCVEIDYKALQILKDEWKFR